MKIAIVHKKYTTTGGTERYVYNFSRYALEKGHEVHIITQEVLQKPVEGLHIHKVDVPSKPSFMQVWGFLKKSRKEVEKIKADVVLGCGKTFPQDIYRSGGGSHKTFLERKLADGKSSKLAHALNPLHRLILWIENKKFQSGSYKYIVTVSNLVREDLLGQHSIPQERIKVIHNGVHLDEFNPAGKEKARRENAKWFQLSPEKVWLVFVGHEFRRKGLDSILEGLSLLSKEERDQFALLVVGKGNQPPYEAKAKDLNLEIAFTGPVSDPSDYYKASDIFILPTHFDPFANVSLEALASGLPVINNPNQWGFRSFDFRV